ncbi:MAG: hypothetical protein JKY37_15015 [Nannocystaceae bacterium]|nr:hypothetical protein [Nannocystaceae bacterium]
MKQRGHTMHPPTPVLPANTVVKPGQLGPQRGVRDGGNWEGGSQDRESRAGSSYGSTGLGDNLVITPDQLGRDAGSKPDCGCGGDCAPCSEPRSLDTAAALRSEGAMVAGEHLRNDRIVDEDGCVTVTVTPGPSPHHRVAPVRQVTRRNGILSRRASRTGHTAGGLPQPLPQISTGLVEPPSFPQPPGGLGQPPPGPDLPPPPPSSGGRMPGGLSHDCQIIAPPAPPPPTFDPNALGGTGGLSHAAPWFPSVSTPTRPGVFAVGRNGATFGHSAASQRTLGLPTTASAAGAAVVDQYDLDLPLCPQGYHFDYAWQACLQNGTSRGQPPPGDLHKYACMCQPGHSYLIGGVHGGTCKPWGWIPAGFDGLPADISVGEGDCPIGHVWDDLQQRCVLDQCPIGFEELGDTGICIDVTPTPVGLVCFPPSVFTQPSPARFRRQEHAIGKCVGGNLQAVAEAFEAAYVICRAAELELDFFVTLSDAELLLLWEASFDDGNNASLAYWFGAANSPDLVSRRNWIAAVVHAVSYAFRNGFRSFYQPVFIRCKSKECVGDAIARHILINTVELCADWFEQIEEDRVTILLHEMFHHAITALVPRDRNNPLCTDFGTECYQNFLVNSQRFANGWPLFEGGNPRRLAEAFDEGNASVSNDMLNNIDNFMSWIWNRWVDREDCRLDTLAW